MKKKLGSLFVTVLAGALLIYSATRSIDFIMLTLPPDRQILAWFGLAALDGGLLAWIAAYLYGSRGGWQRGISLVMIVVDLLGCIAMFTADTIYNTGKAGLTVALDANQMFSFVLALSGIIALNIAAAVVHHLTEPDQLKKQAEEEAFSRIEDQALEKINQSSEMLASQLAPMIADDWMQNTRARYINALGSGARLSLPGETVEATAKDTPPKATSNGHQRTRPIFSIARRRPTVYNNAEAATPAPFDQAEG